MKSSMQQLLEEGKKEGKLEAARNFLENGVALEIVLASTGLSREELKAAGILPGEE